MKRKTITKLLPVAMMFMLASSAAFASAPVKGVATDSVMTVDIPSYVKISTTTPTLNSDCTLQDDYKNVNVTTQFVPAFKVITNDPTTVVTVSAKAPITGATSADSLDGTSGTALVLGFTNTKEGREPQGTALTNAIGSSPAPATNANVIAFTVVPKVALTENSGAQAPTPEKAGNTVKYPLKNGIYDFTYTVSTSAIQNTFSTLDTDGIYKSTLTLTQTTP